MNPLDAAFWKSDPEGPNASNELWVYCRADTLLALFEQEYLDRIRQIDQTERRQKCRAFEEGWAGGDFYALEGIHLAIPPQF